MKASSTHAELNARPQSDRLLRKKEILELTGKSNSAIYREIIDGTFPAPVSIGKRAVAWKASEITQWMDSLQKTVGLEG